MCCQDRKDGRKGYKTHGHPRVQSSIRGAGAVTVKPTKD